MPLGILGSMIDRSSIRSFLFKTLIILSTVSFNGVNFLLGLFLGFPFIQHCSL